MKIFTILWKMSIWDSFFIPKQSFRIKVGVLTVWRIRFSKGALDLIDETLYFNYYTTKSLDTLLVFPHFIRFPLFQPPLFTFKIDLSSNSNLDSSHNTYQFSPSQKLFSHINFIRRLHVKVISIDRPFHPWGHAQLGQMILKSNEWWLFHRDLVICGWVKGQITIFGQDNSSILTIAMEFNKNFSN